MKTIQVSEFRTRLAEILEKVAGGEEYIVSFGKKRINVAALIPFKKYKKNKRRKIGLYDGKVKYSVTPDFKMTPEELIGE